MLRQYFLKKYCLSIFMIYVIIVKRKPKKH